MDTTPLPEGHLAYDEAGNGPPVVLLHGGTLDRRMWGGQLGALPGHRLVRCDARGHGESSTATSDYRHADDVIALLDHLEISEATLVGLSMGGATALDVALEYPARVDGIVISGSGTSEPSFADPFIMDLQQRQAEAAVAGDADTWVELFLRAWVDGPTRQPHEVDALIRNRCREMAMNTIMRHAKPDAVAPTPVQDTWRRLDTIQVPLLGLVGTLDSPDISAMVNRVVASVPTASLETVEGTAHMTNMEKSAVFDRSAGEFINEIHRPS